MIQLIPPDSVVLSLLGSPARHQDEGYRLMKYCLTSPVDNGMLFYNNLTKELLYVDSSELTEQPSGELIDHWFFLPISTDESKLADNILSLLRSSSLRKSPFSSFTIYTTSECNARCFYCFEKGITPSSMCPDTAADVASFIKNHRGKQHTFLRWFGGEPLFHQDPIDSICRTLKEDSAISFSSSIVTNGYLFDEPVLQKAVSLWNLNNVQITLDGTAQIYNRVKNYIYSDSDAFSTVIKNIIAICSYNIPLNIRLNVDLYNSEDVSALIDYLAETLPHKDDVSIYVSPLLEKCGITAHIRDNTQREKVFSIIIPE